MDVPCVYRVQRTYQLAAGAFLPRLLAAGVLPNVPGQRIFLLNENDLEKGCYVIFVQTILACKQVRKKPKRQMNFLTPTKFTRKSQYYGI